MRWVLKLWGVILIVVSIGIGFSFSGTETVVRVLGINLVATYLFWASRW